MLLHARSGDEGTRADPGGIAIREATRRDVPAVCALWKSMMDFHRIYDPRFRFAANADREFERHLAAMLRTSGARVLVADCEGHVAGYIMAEMHVRKPIYPIGNYGFISDISVASEYRRRGIGKALVAGVEEWFRRHKITSVELFVAQANPVSNAFWRSVGYGDYLSLLRRDLEEVQR